MKLFKNTLLALFIAMVGFIKAKQTGSKTVAQQSAGDQNLFGNVLPASSEDFWKLFTTDWNENIQEAKKKMPSKDTMILLNIMNSISDAFNKDYSFAEMNPEFIRSRLTLFLGNTKNQPLLKKFVEIIKGNIGLFPEQFSTIAMKLEQSIKDKNADQFYAIYTSLEYYFRGIPIKPLVTIHQAGWLTRIKNAFMNRARNTYNYLFGSKSTDRERLGVATSKYIITEQDPTTGKAMTKFITQKTDATGRVISYEESIKK